MVSLNKGNLIYVIKIDEIRNILKIRGIIFNNDLNIDKMEDARQS